MPVPACLRYADLFPKVRVATAQQLVREGWSQTKVADLLGVTQAMVSKYAVREPEVDPMVLRLRDALVDPEGPRWCELLEDETTRDLIAAEGWLRQRPPQHVLPQVGLNLAALDGRGDVQAFPGRLSFIEGVPRPTPRVGASRHLATCLQAHHEQDPSVRAMANLRGGEDILAAARRHGEVADLEGDGDRDELYVQAIRPGINMMHDPGAFGIEPCLYVAGPAAKDVAHLIHLIHEELA